MNVIINSTKQFDKAVQKLQPALHKKLVQKINHLAQKIEMGEAYSEFVHRPHKLVLKSGFNSSLFVMRIDPKIRVILSLDKESLFNRFQITLYRLTTIENISKDFRSMAEAIYQADLEGA